MNNNKKTWIIVIIIVLLVIAGIIALASYGTGGDNATSTATTTGSALGQTNAGNGSGAGTKTGTNSPAGQPIVPGTATTSTSSALALYAVNPNPATLGATLTLTGKGFNTQPPTELRGSASWTNNSHMVVTIKNAAGQTGILWEANPSGSQESALSFQLPTRVCTYSVVGNNRCNTYMDILPGTYSITVSIPYMSLTSGAVTLSVK